jgi:hypothetical protein
VITQPMRCEQRTSIGLDVHARSVTGCGLDGQTGEIFERVLRPDPVEIATWITSLPQPVSVAYEAGPTGYGLARHLTAEQIPCLVAAPSKLQRPPGDRIKNDQRDAYQLARLVRLGDIVAVAVPSVEQEAARDLVRARDAARADLMRARHRRSSCSGTASSTPAAPPGAPITTYGCGRSGSSWPEPGPPTKPATSRCCSPPRAGTDWTPRSPSWPRPASTRR